MLCGSFDFSRGQSCCREVPAALGLPAAGPVETAVCVWETKRDGCKMRNKGEDPGCMNGKNVRRIRTICEFAEHFSMYTVAPPGGAEPPLRNQRPSLFCSSPSIMTIRWRKAKKLFAARLCRAAKQHSCLAIYSFQ